MSNRPRIAFKTTRLCDTGRHLLCPARIPCDCACHKPMTDVAAQAVILKLAGARLWPDEPDARQQLADAARAADPFHPDLTRALETLGLT